MLRSIQKCYPKGQLVVTRRLYTSKVRDLPVEPRLNYTYLAQNADAVQSNMQKRNHVLVDAKEIKSLYEKRLAVYNELSRLRSQRNDLSKRTKSEPGRRAEIISQAQAVKTNIKEKEQELDQLEKELLEQALKIPNDSHPDTPVGPEEAARIIKTVGTPRRDKDLQDHVTIAERLDILDLSQAAIVSGSSFYYLQGYGAFLETALVQYALNKAASRGYLAVMTPDIVRKSVAYGCGFQPRTDESSQIYHLTTEHGNEPAQLCLAGTAEIPLAGKFVGKVLEEQTLPRRLVGYGHAFRAEAGGRGTETKGLYRVHQFSKVELFAVTAPAQSEAMLQEFIDLQEEMYTELGLCFRVLDMPTEELGASAYRKFDIEAWLPGRQKWGEISSASNCTDYQARRLSIRYRPTRIADKNTEFCHTVNATAIAVPRIIVAILETFQRPDGTVEIPQVLHKWLPGQPRVLS